MEKLLFKGGYILRDFNKIFKFLYIFIFNYTFEKSVKKEYVFRKNSL